MALIEPLAEAPLALLVCGFAATQGETGAHAPALAALQKMRLEQPAWAMVVDVRDGAPDDPQAQRSLAASLATQLKLATRQVVFDNAEWAATLQSLKCTWLALCTPKDMPDPASLKSLLDHAQQHATPQTVWVSAQACGAGQPGQTTAATLAAPPGSALHGLLSRRALLESRAWPAVGLPAYWSATQLFWQTLLHDPAGELLFAGLQPGLGLTDALTEHDRSHWLDPRCYVEALAQGMREPLARSAARHADRRPAVWLQRAVLLHLGQYFVVDQRERAPTALVTGALAERFHRQVKSVLAHIEPAQVLALPAPHWNDEIRQVLLAFQSRGGHGPLHVDGWDRHGQLLRLRYYMHGDTPAEAFVQAGQVLSPRYSKNRACRYFGQVLLRERVIWLPAQPGAPLLADIGDLVGKPPQSILASDRRYGRVGQAQPALSTADSAKRWMARWVSRLPLLRSRFARAWVFVDRNENADDNAEHLYRWVREHHPEVNAWFLLNADSPDWDRLHTDGFRLMPPGWRRQVLLLNAEHIISSHAEYMDGGLDRRVYGPLMRWQYSFLQHGVTKDDMSHWMGPLGFDRFITASPEEHASIVGDDTAYPYTDREVQRTGFPRHDRLLALAAAVPPAQQDLLLMMPTWRGSLSDARIQALAPAERRAAVADSDYVCHWRALLASDELRDMVQRHGKTVVFMPHPNAVPFIDLFGVPTYIQVATFADTSMQALFARCTALVTDYTSVAFEFALMRRLVVYYQFDREAFYGGAHNWRPGHYDYDRDGFGPVAFDQAQLLDSLRQFLQGGCQVVPPYLANMVRALPDTDGQACQRTYDSIVALGPARHP